MKKKRKKEGSTEIKKERKERRKWELSSCVCFSADSRLLMSWNCLVPAESILEASWLAQNWLACQILDSLLVTDQLTPYSLLINCFPSCLSRCLPHALAWPLASLVVASCGLSDLYSLGGVCLCGIWLQHGSCSWSGYSTALLSTSALMCSISNQTTHSHLAFALFESVTNFWTHLLSHILSLTFLKFCPCLVTWHILFRAPGRQHHWSLFNVLCIVIAMRLLLQLFYRGLP